MSDSPKTAGELLRARRMDLGLSQRAAALSCGVPQARFSRIEAGQTQPSIPTLQRLLDGLGAELHLEVRPRGAELLERREKARSLWLNRLVVGELARDPDRVAAIARANIDRWRPVHAGRALVLAALDRWNQLLDEGVEAVVAALTGLTDEAADMRQNSPFAGVLTQEQREQALASFRTEWERRHPAEAAAIGANAVDDR